MKSIGNNWGGELDSLSTRIDNKLPLTGGTLTGQLNIKSNEETQLVINQNHSNTVSQRSNIDIGNNKPTGTAGSNYGTIALYGNGAYYTLLSATDSTANRSIVFPDKTGTVAIAGDVVSKSGDTMSGTLYIEKLGTSQSQEFSRLYLGNNIPYGTSENSTGFLRLYAKGSGRVDIYDNEGIVTGNRILQVPDKSGTIALVPTLQKIRANIYIENDSAWISCAVDSGRSFEDYDFIAFNWHRSDNENDCNCMRIITSKSNFKSSSQSSPIYVVIDAYSGGDSRCVRVCWKSAQSIDVYRGADVYAFNRLSILGIKV